MSHGHQQRGRRQLSQDAKRQHVVIAALALAIVAVVLAIRLFIVGLSS